MDILKVFFGMIFTVMALFFMVMITQTSTRTAITVQVVKAEVRKPHKSQKRVEFYVKDRQGHQWWSNDYVVHTECPTVQYGVEKNVWLVSTTNAWFWLMNYEPALSTDGLKVFCTN